MFEHHYEKNLIINNRILKHKGIFRVDELFSTINQVLEEKGYEKREKKTEETVTKKGRRTYLELRPFKVKTEYAVLMIKLRITLDNVTEVTEKIDAEMKKFQQGEVEIAFDAWVLTDYYKRWGMKPWFYFLKGLINKYIYTTPLEAGLPGELSADTAQLYARINKLLKSYRPETGEAMKEEEVMEKMKKEISKLF